MDFIWGVILIIFGMFCWVGQTISAFAPKMAAKLGLTEPESDVDPTYYADARGEAIWDTTITWVLPVAGILLIVDSPFWAYFGLVGGGIYLYFAGRGILSRLAMQRRGIRIGKPKSVGAAYVFLFLWGVIAVVTIIMAVSALPLP